MNPVLRDRPFFFGAVRGDNTDDLTADLDGAPPTQDSSSRADLAPGSSLEPPPASVSASRAAPAAAAAPPQAPAAQPIAVGSTLNGRYVLEKVLARGGTALVFRACDLLRQSQTGVEQVVALKILRPELGADASTVERLKREFRHELSLSHPNIVRALDLESDAGRWFLTQELLEGESLADALRGQSGEGPLPQAQAILRACAEALMFAHGHGIVHADFKPGNVFVTRGGQSLRDRVKVLDFGAATAATLTAGASSDAEPHFPAASLCYASPEVLLRQRPERRDDIFSFACVAYEVIGRLHPFGRRSALEARDRRLLAPRLWGLTDRQWFALEAALSFRREDRPATLQQLVDELFSAPLLTAALPAPDALPSIRVPPRDFPIFPLIESGAGKAEKTGARPAATQGQNGNFFRTPSADVQGSRAPGASAALWVFRGIAVLVTAVLFAVVGLPRLEEFMKDTGTDGQAVVSQAVVSPATPGLSEGLAGKGAQAVAHEAGSEAGGGMTAEWAAPQSPMPAVAPASIGFDMDSLSVSEQASAVVLILTRENGLEDRSRVHWRSVPDTAQPGQDYVVDAYGVAAFSEGEDRRAIYIPLVHDSVAEPTERFTVELYEPSAGTQLGAIHRVVVTVNDDD